MMINLDKRLQRITWIFLVLLCSSLFEGCTSTVREDGSEGKSSKDVPSKRSLESRDGARHIVFFGNSLTAGYGLEESQAFPALLQARLDSLDLPYVAVNAGLSGETTSGGLNRIDWVLNQPMDIFVLELGANDALRGFDLKHTTSNLQGIIDKVRAKHPTIPFILAGMKAPPNMGAAYTQDFENIFPSLAQANDLALIPFLLDGVAGNSNLNLSDGKHPNEEGQRIVLENVWSILKPFLEKSL